MSAIDMKSLFSGVKNQKKVDKSYDFISKALAENKKSCTNDVTHISKWFKAKYENTYNKPMLGYNFYNCRNTIKLLGQKYSLSNWEVCVLINKWFKTFHSLGYDRVAGDDSLTLSILKTDWIVNGLFSNSRPNDNKRNASYNVHSQSRRLSQSKSPNKPNISKQAF